MTTDTTISNEQDVVNDELPFTAPVPEREFIVDTDKFTLDMSRLKIALAKSQADLLAAQHENSELKHRNFTLSIALKYKLGDGDVITEQGEIIRHS